MTDKNCFLIIGIWEMCLIQSENDQWCICLFEARIPSIHEPFREKTNIVELLRKVSTRIRLSMTHRLTRKDTVHPLGMFLFEDSLLYTHETECIGPD